MEKTPLSMRKHIAIAGETNAGKSSLFNRLLGQETAIVSEVRGTTTDPVVKAMELTPYGRWRSLTQRGWEMRQNLAANV